MHATSVVLKKVVREVGVFGGAWNVYRVCEWEKGMRAQLMNFFKNP